MRTRVWIGVLLSIALFTVSQLPRSTTFTEGKVMPRPGDGGFVMEEHEGPDRVITFNLRGQITGTDQRPVKDASSGPIKFRVPAHKVALAIVDPWTDDLFWCDWYMDKIDNAYRDEWRPAVDRARSLGMQVMWLTTPESADLYESHPARQRMMLTREEWASVRRFIPKGKVPAIPAVPPVGNRQPDWDKCYKEASERHRRTGLMKPTSTWREALKLIHPAFDIHAEDSISGERAEIFAFLRKRGIEMIVYAGGSTNMCVVYKDYGMATICAYYGFKCAVARSMTSVITPKGDNPSAYKAAEERMFGYFERYFGPTVDIIGDLINADEDLVPDPTLQSFPRVFDKTFHLTNQREFTFTKQYTPKGRRIDDSTDGDGGGGGGSGHQAALEMERLIDRVAIFACIAVAVAYILSALWDTEHKVHAT